jgi:hypothetical protein
MSEAAPLPSYRLKLPCADEREFRERFLQKYVSRGIFVPSERPKPVGTRLRLKLEIKGGAVLVSGDGMVTSVTQPGPNAKPGMTVRLTALHPESIQFSLSPSGNAPPAPRPPATPPTAARPALSPPPLRAPAAPPKLAAPTPPPPPPASRASDDEGLFDLSDPIPETPHAAPDEGVMSSTEPAIPVPFELLEPEEARDLEREQAAGSPAPTPPPGASSAGPSAPIGAARRRLPSLRVLVLLGFAIAVVAAVAIGGTVASRKAETARRERARIDALLRVADQRLLEGRLAAAKGDSALDHLLEAKGAAPDDERVVTRLKLLADKFEQLGDRALARKNQREAAVHFKATLMADPTRARAREKLDDIEAKAPRAGPAR